MSQLRASIVIDYQNVHLTGHDLYSSTRLHPRHHTLVDPLLFASQLIRVRNSRQRAGNKDAVLRRVLVYRGQPSSEHDPTGYARNQAQRAQWERDRRVQVTLRPLKYHYQRDATGLIATTAAGLKILRGAPREKGVDVMCALSTVREAQDPSVDLVILATADSDLAPALDEVQRLGTAKIETFTWYDPKTRREYRLHPTDRTHPLWNTRLNEDDFRACWDPTAY